ncbi:MAG: thioredoxin family protein [Candidatus Aceula lacicola]|nr:thioredoxin family protein [Candidatus Aceula lacicola]
MSLMASIKIPLGTKIPGFQLSDPNGQSHSSDNLFGEKGLLVVFTCNHCPYANAVWPRLISIAKDAKQEKVNSIAINPNINPAYPDDAPEKMIDKIKDFGIDFPYLVDEKQQIAKDFKAQCTPDVYLFDGNKELVYHGRIDNNWQDEDKVTCHELKEAIDSLVAGEEGERRQNPSMGCSIKWLETKND